MVDVMVDSDDILRSQKIIEDQRTEIKRLTVERDDLKAAFALLTNEDKSMVSPDVLRKRFGELQAKIADLQSRLETNTIDKRLRLERYVLACIEGAFLGDNVVEKAQKYIAQVDAALDAETEGGENV